MKRFHLATIAIAAAVLTGCATGPTSAPQCDPNSADPACAKSEAAQKAKAEQTAQQQQIEAESNARFDALQKVLDAAPTRVKLDVNDAPRFNESEGHGPKRLHPVEDYFDDLSRHLIWEIYKRDFQLFKYDFDNPGNKMPIGEIDLDEVHAKLGD